MLQEAPVTMQPSHGTLQVSLMYVSVCVCVCVCVCPPPCPGEGVLLHRPGLWQRLFLPSCSLLSFPGYEETQRSCTMHRRLCCHERHSFCNLTPPPPRCDCCRAHQPCWHKAPLQAAPKHTHVRLQRAAARAAAAAAGRQLSGRFSRPYVCQPCGPSPRLWLEKSQVR
jgi:hypothetical protein